VSIEAIWQGVGAGVLKTKVIDSHESSFVSPAKLWNKLYRLQPCSSFERTKKYLFYLIVIFQLESSDIYIRQSDPATGPVWPRGWVGV